MRKKLLDCNLSIDRIVIIIKSSLENAMEKNVILMSS